LGSKAEKLKAKQWGFSSKKSELFVDEPGRTTGRSALPPETDIVSQSGHFRKVPLL
jgi:hypothetical protein